MNGKKLKWNYWIDVYKLFTIELISGHIIMTMAVAKYTAFSYFKIKFSVNICPIPATRLIFVFFFCFFWGMLLHCLVKKVYIQNHKKAKWLLSVWQMQTSKNINNIWVAILSATRRFGAYFPFLFIKDTI